MTREKRETPASVEAKKRRVRELIVRQRAMALEEQWTMAAAIKIAKSEATVAIEALRLGQ